jgi:hypothetical protein
VVGREGALRGVDGTRLATSRWTTKHDLESGDDLVESVGLVTSIRVNREREVNEVLVVVCRSVGHCSS